MSQTDLFLLDIQSRAALGGALIFIGMILFVGLIFFVDYLDKKPYDARR